MQRSTVAVAQGRKGTGDGKKAIGIRCPPEIYAWLESGRLPRETDTALVLRTLEKMRDLEEAAGVRLRELEATAVLEQRTFGQMISTLALEALDSRRKGKK